MLSAMLLAAAQAAVPARPAPHAPLGEETVIPFAAGGNLREWQRGGIDNGVLYVRDRTEHWYEVTLTGPCRMDRALDTLTYTTDVNGTFDRFSQVRLLRYPETSCGVASIRSSLPPPSRQGSRKFPKR